VEAVRRHAPPLGFTDEGEQPGVIFSPEWRPVGECLASPSASTRIVSFRRLASRIALNRAYSGES
jgi:hypothetical protein